MFEQNPKITSQILVNLKTMISNDLLVSDVSWIGANDELRVGNNLRPVLSVSLDELIGSLGENADSQMLDEIGCRAKPEYDVGHLQGHIGRL